MGNAKDKEIREKVLNKGLEGSWVVLNDERKRGEGGWERRKWSLYRVGGGKKTEWIQ